MARIFVIDDDPLFREALELSLEVQGHEVRGAETAKTAFEMIDADPPDVVISDILMPTHDGIEVLREMTSRWPTIPVVVMSGGGKVDHDDLLIWARSLGAASAFAKPFDIKAMSDAIKELLAISREGAN